jgi:hypothetical protein
MGGTTAPLDENPIMEVQQPLPPGESKAKFPRVMFPKIDIPARVRILENLMTSEQFKLNTWVKLARKKGIPYFEPLPTL